MKLEELVNRHEKSIAAASGLATAIGLLFAAISALASLQQLRTLNREHLTPYRAVLFTAKLDAYRRTYAASKKFEMEFFNHQGTLKFDVRITGKDAQTTIDHAWRLQQDEQDFEIGIADSTIVWPKDFQSKLDLVQTRARRMMSCSRAVINKYEDQFVNDSCSSGWAGELLPLFHEADEAYLSAMRENVRADDLQTVGG